MAPVRGKDHDQTKCDTHGGGLFVFAGSRGRSPETGAAARAIKKRARPAGALERE
ncbi:MAG: hypothetical protein LBP86_09120 [Azoarcus sp.]|nr:hypothetical protein [Azoarcus sp.]